MISNHYVDDYIQQWRDGKIVLNQERIDLIHYLETNILTRDDVYFDDKQIENCIKFIENGISLLNLINASSFLSYF